MSLELLYKLITFLQIFQAIKGVSNNNSNNNVMALSPRYLKSADFAPYEAVTSTDEDTHQYIPYYVKMHRCQGADIKHTPAHRICMPVSFQNVNVSVFKGGNLETITLQNHTACKYKCRKTASVCSKYEQWNSDTCQCNCNILTKTQCTGPREWGDTSCCTCRNAYECKRSGGVLNTATCDCAKKSECRIDVDVQKSARCSRDVNSLAVGNVVVIALLEFVVIVIGCLLVYYWCGHRRRNIRSCSQDNQVYLSATCLVDPYTITNEKGEQHLYEAAHF